MKMTAGQPSIVPGGPLLEAVALSKSFGPVEVLKDVSLAVNPGEVHAIIGENGAGKSTLMKLLAGHLQPTRGELRIDGKTVTLTGPVDAERRGTVLVHQEILLAPDLTVAQNVYLGGELPKGMVVDDRAMNEGARRAIRNLGADVDPDVVVRRLSIAQRQLVQIATFRRKIGALGRVVKGAQQRKTRRERPAGVLQSLMVRAGGFTG